MPDPGPLTGQTLSHYRVLDKLGEGGMGEVYRAHDEQLDRDVALKVLPAGLLADEASRKRFRKEALALAKLNHPNIATIFEFGSQEGVDFLVMELIPGVPLDERLGYGPFAQPEAIQLGIQLAEGLSAAHAQGVIHRDLKPGNLFVTPDGRVKILDFGLSKRVGPKQADELTRTRPQGSDTVSGTVPYMAPEQLRGESKDLRSDIYSAGAVLYQMVTGQRPFPQEAEVDLIAAILLLAPPVPRSLDSSISADLESVILKALEKDAAQRYQSARELRAALEGLSASAVPESAAPSPAEPVPAAVSVSAAARANAWKMTAVAAMALLTGTAMAVGGYFYLRPRPKLTEKDTIVLAGFANSTGDAVFDGTLRQGLAVQLEQSPFLSLVSDPQIQQTLRLMGQAPDARLTPELAADLCRRVGSAAVLDGSIAQIGSAYLLTVKAVNCATGNSLASASAQARDKNHVLDALGNVASEIRGKLGESLSMVRQLDTSLEQATTPSLEALQAYTLAREAAIQKNDMAATIPLYQRAIRLDPKFAMAYASLAVTYSNLGQRRQAAENAQKSYELREAVSEREKVYIEAHYHQYVTGDLESARKTYELWAQTYPRDWAARNNLAIIFFNLGQFDRAIPALQDALKVNPGARVSYANVANAYLFLNRPEEAWAAAQETRAKNLDSPFLRILMYMIAFLRNDEAGMAEQVAWSQGKPGVEDVLLANEADSAAYSGRLGRARKLTRQAMASAERAGGRETAGNYEAQAALRETLFGNPAQARQAALASLGLSESGETQYAAALALAFAGSPVGTPAQAEKLANDLAKRFPQDTLIQFNYLPTVHAQLALNRWDPSGALAALQAAGPYETATTAVHFNFLGLYPIYVRGNAYLAAHQGSAAAAEFQKILDHRGIVGNCPIGVLAHLGLGRAYALQGDPARARAAYQDFLALWKDADPDVPILKQARAEHAKLK